VRKKSKLVENSAAQTTNTNITYNKIY